MIMTAPDTRHSLRPAEGLTDAHSGNIKKKKIDEVLGNYAFFFFTFSDQITTRYIISRIDIENMW